MTPFEQAIETARRCKLDFWPALQEHLREGYVYSSPECFIMAVDTFREFGESAPEEAIFVTLAVGNLAHFLEIDPRRETRKWLAFCREDGGKVHWLPYQDLRPKRSRL